MSSATRHASRSRRAPSMKQLAEGVENIKKRRNSEHERKIKTRAGEPVDHQNVPPSSHNNRRTVTDPVTGKDVEIDDFDRSTFKDTAVPLLSVPNANLNKSTPVKTEPGQSGEEYRRNQDITAPPDPIEPGATSDVPIHGEKTNVLFHPTPSVSYEPMYAKIELRANILCACLFMTILFFGSVFGARPLGLFVLDCCVVSAVFLWSKDLIRRGRNVEWSSEKKRGETAVVNLIPESVEWLNSAINIVWGLVNPEMFAGVADTLEDVMQANVPAVIENVKVNDISQGSNPIRILSLRSLPDSQMTELRDDIHKRDEQNKDPEEIAADEEGGDFYNLEATVAYHALPDTGDGNAKARNMGMQLIFYLGIKGLFGVPFPIWVQLDGLVATARIRVALGPAAPFVKTLSFTLMGVPHIEASCVPLIEKGANILNLPLIANFVNWAMATAAKMFVAPKSMTIDVGSIIEGSSSQKDTNAVGVLFVRIHKATGLSKQDAGGSHGGGSDPYICVAFSKFGKPQYCTRVIQDNLNPIFSECAALLVTPDIIRVKEKLSLELWDSDRSTADDIVGNVELDLKKLFDQPGRMFPQVSSLSGVGTDTTMPGELHWEVGFFRRTHFRPALRTDGKDPFMPKQLKDKILSKKEKEKEAAENEQKEAIACTPPDPLWPSGILSVVVHQIVGLELENIQGSDGNRKGKEYEPGRLEAGELKEEQGKKLPSSYCTIIVNDELVYKTRTKVTSSRPIFEAGTERFVRDWRSAIATVTVRDARHREHDPIIGVVPLKLSEVLLKSSETTRWYPLDGGIGFGRVLISVMFRSVELTLPPSQVSFGEIGTFEFISESLATTGYAPSPNVKISLRTGGSTARIKGDRCSRTSDGTGLNWDLTVRAGRMADGREEKDVDMASGNGMPRPWLGLPVQYRYRSPVFFEFRVPGKHSKDAYAAIWLQDLMDSVPTYFDVPIWKCDNPLRLSQGYITEANWQDVPDLKLEKIGRLRFHGRFKPGADREHLRFVSDNDSRETIETWEACYAEGVRSEEVKAEVPKLTNHMHQRSLTEDFAATSTMTAEEKQRWIAKNGADWTGAFGKNPKEMVEASGKGDGMDEGETEQDRNTELPPRHFGLVGGANREADGPETGEAKQETQEMSSPQVDGAGEAALGDDSDSSAEMVAAGADLDGNPSMTNGHGHHQRWQSEDTSSSNTSGVSGGSGSGVSHASSGISTASSSSNPVKRYKEYKERNRDLHRKHRGLMQWKPIRNMAFAKDEATFAVRRILKVGKLEGRAPDVDTEA